MISLLGNVTAPLRRLIVDAARVPRDLATVTTVAEADEVDPESVGMTSRGIDSIWRAAESMYATGMHPAVSLVIRRHGEVVLKRSIGHASGNGPGESGDDARLMTPDTPVCLYSASKAMAAMPVHLLLSLIHI